MDAAVRELVARMTDVYVINELMTQLILPLSEAIVPFVLALKEKIG
jgi:hypothetical protein